MVATLHNGVCVSLSNATVAKVLVTFKSEYLHHRNWQTLPIRA